MFPFELFDNILLFYESNVSRLIGLTDTAILNSYSLIAKVYQTLTCRQTSFHQKWVRSPPTLNFRNRKFIILLTVCLGPICDHFISEYFTLFLLIQTSIISSERYPQTLASCASYELISTSFSNFSKIPNIQPAYSSNSGFFMTNILNICAPRLDMT